MCGAWRGAGGALGLTLPPTGGLLLWGSALRSGDIGGRCSAAGGSPHVLWGGRRGACGGLRRAAAGTGPQTEPCAQCDPTPGRQLQTSPVQSPSQPHSHPNLTPPSPRPLCAARCRTVRCGATRRCGVRLDTPWGALGPALLAWGTSMGTDCRTWPWVLPWRMMSVEPSTSSVGRRVASATTTARWDHPAEPHRPP